MTEPRGNNNPYYINYTTRYGRLVMIKIPMFVREIINNIDELLMSSGYYEFIHGFKMEDNIISRYYNSILAEKMADKVLRDIMRIGTEERRILFGNEDRDDGSRNKFSIRSYGRDMQKIRILKTRIGITE